MLIYAADDERLALEYIERSIRKASPDSEVIIFNKSKELLDAMEDRKADVVFLDIQMPGLTGIEIAKRLKEIHPRVNIVFATGFDEYMMEAFNLYASGYILKPASVEDVKDQLDNLRFPIIEEKDVSIKTFGNFTVFNKGEAVSFRLAKSKELLAYLVDRDGALVTRREAFSILWEDQDYSRNGQKNLSKVVKGIETDLEEAGILEIFEKEKDGFRVVKDKFDCDLYDFYDGKDDTLFKGEYMEQYSWGEDFKGRMMDY